MFKESMKMPSELWRKRASNVLSSINQQPNWALWLTPLQKTKVWVWNERKSGTKIAERRIEIPPVRDISLGHPFGGDQIETMDSMENMNLSNFPRSNPTNPHHFGSFGAPNLHTKMGFFCNALLAFSVISSPPLNITSY